MKLRQQGYEQLRIMKVKIRHATINDGMKISAATKKNLYWYWREAWQKLKYRDRIQLFKLIIFKDINYDRRQATWSNRQPKSYRKEKNHKSDILVSVDKRMHRLYPMEDNQTKTMYRYQRNFQEKYHGQKPNTQSGKTYYTNLR